MMREPIAILALRIGRLYNCPVREFMALRTASSSDPLKVTLQTHSWSFQRPMRHLPPRSNRLWTLLLGLSKIERETTQKGIRCDLNLKLPEC
ncbi:hypothetical protein PAXRUDRAFT_216098 [Paxillus rubicundulus Ve08.2h10]|uniref:Unplaced genomic scaffold scaffold_1098, whole genome shotgun sequence n=1 Tax=Paxillus rubicundulus Ve08.2h10 TaxID=930991 RepID=A0A0D0CYX7_9AGAM|nr:hypothetical protein PAXRUDRAFT_216098 [Paxillus rubicundulus Ve08.2h10]